MYILFLPCTMIIQPGEKMEINAIEFDNEHDAYEEAEMQKAHFALEYVPFTASVKVYRRTMLPIPDAAEVELSRWFVVVKEVA